MQTNYVNPVHLNSFFRYFKLLILIGIINICCSEPLFSSDEKIFSKMDVVAFTAPPDICINEGIQTGQGGGTPAGGIYSGPGVIDDGNGSTFSFDPMIAGVGIHTLTYTEDENVFSDDIVVFEQPFTLLNGPDELCIGETTNLFPSTGGVWVSQDPNVAIVDNTGTVTAVGSGETSFIFTNVSTGCSSEPTDPIFINPIPEVAIFGSDLLCIGETTSVSPSVGGEWSSQDESVAVVDNTGTVTALGAGETSFIFVDDNTGCESMPTDPIIVNAQPIVTVSGADQICIGETTNLLPSTGGVWVSQDPNVAIVDNTGTVTAVGSGETSFIFTNVSTGCSSEPTDPIFINPIPEVAIFGSDLLCIGETTNLSPSVGGEWSSQDESVAVVDNTGTVTALGAGVTSFIFVDDNTGCESMPTDPIIVNAQPIVTVSGADQICIGETTNLLPSTGGVWVSQDPNVAIVDNTGTVTGVGSGETSFIFTNTSTGCSSEPTDPIIINPIPEVAILGSDLLCIGETTSVSPSVGGVWSSQDESVAVVDNTGTVTALGAGVTSFIFVDGNTGCESMPTDPIIVNAQPIVTVSGADQICIGETTNLIPSSGGVWSSQDESIAVVDNTGTVTAVGAGLTSFIFVDDNTGCESMPTDPIIVNAKPIVTISGDDQICIGETTTLSPGVGGVWLSQNPQIATVTNGGLVTALSPGISTFVFTDIITGCESEATDPVIVNPNPIVSLIGPSEILIGETTSLLPSTGGTWLSQDESVATVDNNGVIIGVGIGITNFIFTDLITLCVSDPSDNVIVNSSFNTFVGMNADWNDSNNWTQGIVPTNPILTEIILSQNVSLSTIEGLVIGAGGSIEIDNEVTFTVSPALIVDAAGQLTNNGVLIISED